MQFLLKKIVKDLERRNNMGYTLNNIKKCPFKGLSSSYISSDFGNRTFWNPVTQKNVTGFHNGIDMTSGSTIVATARGKVTACRNSVQGYTESLASGNYVTLYHGNNVYTTYCHMAYGSVKVKVGDIVECGQELGTKGTTGYSTGPHLHYGVQVNGSWVDPKPYLLGTVALPQYGEATSTPASTMNTTYKVGDKVKFTGVLYRDSQGNGAGQSRTNLDATIYLVNPGSKCPYNINNGLGWVRAEDLSSASENIQSQERYYTVVKGDTLWGIAQKFYGNGSRYQEIAKANNIANANLIHVGQKLLIP